MEGACSMAVPAISTRPRTSALGLVLNECLPHIMPSGTILHGNTIDVQTHDIDNVNTNNYVLGVKTLQSSIYK